MKKLAALTALSAAAILAQAQSHYVRPYVRSDGTLVQGHQQTNPDSTRLNNWSTEGNVNPYTGQAGTVNPYTPAPQPAYQLPQMPNPPQTPTCGVTSTGQYVCR